MANKSRNTLYLDLMLTDGYARDCGVELPENIICIIAIRCGSICKKIKNLTIKMHYTLIKSVYQLMLNGLTHGCILKFVWFKPIPLNEDIFLCTNQIPHNVTVKFIWSQKIPLNTLRMMKKHQNMIQNQWIEINDNKQTITAQKHSNILNPSISQQSIITEHKNDQDTIEEPKKVVFKINNSSTYKLYPWLKPVKIIAKGAYSAICCVSDMRNKKKYVVKKHRGIFAYRFDAKKVLKEIQLMRLFDSRYVMSLNGVILPSKKEKDTFEDIYTIMEKYDTNLSRIIKSKQVLTERHIRYLIYQIARGLEYIHSGNIVHYMIRPENILVNVADCKIKITDFSFASVNGDDEERRTDEHQTQRWYKPPETIICHDPHNAKIDIWSLGCIAAELYVRKPIFPGSNHIKQLKLIFHYLGTPKDINWIKAEDAKRWIMGLEKKEAQDLSLILKDSSESDRDFIRWLLIMEPHKRPNATDVVKHKWLKEFYREKDYKECEIFSVSDEFNKCSKTVFGLRHMMYQELTDLHRELIEKHCMNESDRKENNIRSINKMIERCNTYE